MSISYISMVFYFPCRLMWKKSARNHPIPLACSTFKWCLETLSTKLELPLWCRARDAAFLIDGLPITTVVWVYVRLVCYSTAKRVPGENRGACNIMKILRTRAVSALISSGSTDFWKYVGKSRLSEIKDLFLVLFTNHLRNDLMKCFKYTNQIRKPWPSVI